MNVDFIGPTNFWKKEEENKQKEEKENYTSHKTD